MASSPGQGPSGAELMGLGAVLALAVVAPMVLGIVLDAVFHASPVFLFAGLLVGIGVSVCVVYVRYVKPYWGKGLPARSSSGVPSQRRWRWARCPWQATVVSGVRS